MVGIFSHNLSSIRQDIELREADVRRPLTKGELEDISFRYGNRIVVPEKTDEDSLKVMTVFCDRMMEELRHQLRGEL